MDKLKEIIGSIQFDHSIWSSELNYISLEIKLYEEQIVKLTEFYFGKPEQEQLSTLLHGFGDHKARAEQIQSRIKRHIRFVNSQIRSNGHLQSITDGNHQKTKEIIEQLRKTYVDLKDKFDTFTTALLK